MVRSPCCDDNKNLKKGPWTPEEDQKLIDYINKHGHGSWRALPKLAGLNRCGKSCRLRWTNYLRPDIKRGKFSEEEERLIINLHAVLGNKWSRIATHLPGRTDNEIKNFWNTHVRKKLLHMGLDPNTHKPRTDLNHLLNLAKLLCAAQFGGLLSPWEKALKLQVDAAQLAKIQLMQNLLQVMNTSTAPNIETSTSLLEAQNLNKYKELFNGISSLYSKDPTSTPQDFLSPTIIPQAPAEPQPIADSWACLGDEFIQNGLNMNTSTLGSSYDIPNRNTHPALISGSPEITSINKNECCSAMAHFSANSSNSSIFESWEKLVDDETSESYWRSMLDLTSATSSPSSW